MEESSGSNKKAIIGLVVIVLLAVAATGAVIAAGNNKPTGTDSVASTSPSVSASSSPSTSATSSSSFKDGSYKATGTYNSPGGPESIDVNVTLTSGTITDVSIVKHPNDGNAEMYQGQFEAGYKTLVVGKKISDVNLSRVSGSSLTSIGFNKAIADIENQAKS